MRLRFSLRPWPRRADRRKDVETARQMAAQSQRHAARDAQVTRDLRHLAAENHWAELVQNVAVLGRRKAGPYVKGDEADA